MNIKEIENLKCVYDKFVDNTSKRIFTYRTMYSLTEDPIFLRRDVETSFSSFLKIEEIINSGSKVWLFGAGKRTRQLLRILIDERENITGIIDNNSELWGTEVFGKKVSSLKKNSIENDDAYVVIPIKKGNKEIYNQLINLGIKEEKILNIGGEINEAQNRQYFDIEQLICGDEEVFIDAGAYKGETTEEFIHWAKRHNKKAKLYSYLFEPDDENYEVCLKRQYEIEVELVKAGLWSSERILSFTNDGTAASRIGDIGTSSITCYSIDDKCKKKPTFIKMDIEGSEYEALLGAKRTISENKPKLAISVYHKKEDIFNIPRLILQLNNEYKFYLRHYSFGVEDTVLYAI